MPLLPQLPRPVERDAALAFASVVAAALAVLSNLAFPCAGFIAGNAISRDYALLTIVGEGGVVVGLPLACVAAGLGWMSLRRLRQHDGPSRANLYSVERAAHWGFVVSLVLASLDATMIACGWYAAVTHLEL